MHENPISKEIVDAAFKIHTKLGPGLLESVYEILLAHEIKCRGLLINFNEELIRNGISRVVNGLEE